jgi:amidase
VTTWISPSNKGSDRDQRHPNYPRFAAAERFHTADGCIFVERIKQSGAIIIGKTNAPEFGLGSQTYNRVFGTTLNAYDQKKIAGGSSGGAAVSVALSMQAVADGSDFFGSLRNPPAFNICLYATLIGSPAISVPVGFNQDGLPMGMQIIGRNHADLAVLQLAYAYEQATQWVSKQPPALLTKA